MTEILHRIGTTAPRERVYRALTTVDGLSDWWTTDTSSGDDATLKFRFGEVGGFDMKVLDQQPDHRVEWQVVDGPDEWLQTKIIFELEPDGEWTIVRFAHTGWKARSEFQHHCSTKWATFLMSLKSLVETGVGAPHPHDIQISNWH